MSKHTDKTNSMVHSLKRRLDNFTKSNYTYKFETLEPMDKDAAILSNIEDKYKALQASAARRGYVTTWNIESKPERLCKYNCIGCRKRKEGKFIRFGARITQPSNNYNKNPYSWFQPLGKVCSNECTQLMTMRLM